MPVLAHCIPERPRRLGLLVAMIAMLAACSGADEGVRTVGSEGSTSGSGSATASGSGSGSATASGSGSAIGSETATGSGSSSAVSAAEKDCTSVGEDLESQATSQVDLRLTDYAFEPDTIGIDAAVITFATTNAGTQAHELAFLPGGGEVPFTEDGAPDEAALQAAGAFELEAYGPGQDCNATYEFEPGTYTLFCIVEAPDGQTHYEKGMRGALEVR